MNKVILGLALLLSVSSYAANKVEPKPMSNADKALSDFGMKVCLTGYPEAINMDDADDCGYLVSKELSRPQANVFSMALRACSRYEYILATEDVNRRRIQSGCLENAVKSLPANDLHDLNKIVPSCNDLEINDSPRHCLDQRLRDANVRRNEALLAAKSPTVEIEHNTNAVIQRTRTVTITTQKTYLLKDPEHAITFRESYPIIQARVYGEKITTYKAPIIKRPFLDIAKFIPGPHAEEHEAEGEHSNEQLNCK